MKSWLKRRVNWSGWQLGVLKWTSMSFGILLGANFPEACKPFGLLFLAIMLVGGFYTGKWWFCCRSEESL